MGAAGAVTAAYSVGSTMVSSSFPHVSSALIRTLSIGRGGATAAVTFAAADLTTKALQLAGGGDVSDTTDANLDIFGMSIPPEARAVFYMACSMALHYLGYSLARPSTVALFTSAKTGFSGNPAAYPLAMAFISPTSLLLLMGYGRILQKNGPRAAIKQTSLIFASILCGTALLIELLANRGFLSHIGCIPTLVKFLCGGLFIFRESYVQLLTSQHWSFMVSVLTPSQSSTWVARISGMTSISSAAAGFGVQHVIEKVGLTGAICGTGIALICSMLCAERAYSISAAHGFNPADEEKRKKANAKKGDKKAIVEAASKEHAGMFQMARALFQRVPVLGALFCEILACQGLSTLLNVCFVTKLSSSMPDDQERAGWMGRFYATTNVVSSVVQFFILPPLMARVEPSVVWKAMPMVMVVLMASQCLEKNPSLHLVAGSLMAMKVMEFSARRMLDEMVYVPLDFESRYVGKEVIGVFGFRFGKSGMSLALSGLSSIFGNFGLQQLSYLTTGASVAWLSMAWRLSTYVPTGAEAEATYKKTHAQ
eukprot:scaffold100610_cov53-Attheya_sp.AAC.2